MVEISCQVENSSMSPGGDHHIRPGLDQSSLGPL
jgi:hypothetical protein